MSVFFRILIGIIIPIAMKLVDVLRWWLDKNPDVREKMDAYVKRNAGTFLRAYFEAKNRRAGNSPSPSTSERRSGEREAGNPTPAATERAKKVVGDASKKTIGAVARLKNWLFSSGEPKDEEKDELEELKRKMTRGQASEEAQVRRPATDAPTTPQPTAPEPPEESLSERCRRIVEEERHKRDNPPPTEGNK